MNLNQVTLPVNDMSAACTFYLTLGFTQIVDTSHYARFHCPEGDSTFSLSLTDDANEHGVVVYFETEHLDDWVNTLIARGIEITQMPKDESYLWREAIVHDPSGNKLKLYYAGDNRVNPPWRVTINHDDS
ncbi:VOC family protein [Thalassotalea euphylliae]|uniref:VOC family protein n=1 Tax=Thalassotalea euphylliae TaxID=1655234 RepID=UPI003644F8E8